MDHREPLSRKSSSSENLNVKPTYTHLEINREVNTLHTYIPTTFTNEDIYHHCTQKHITHKPQFCVDS